MPRCRRLPMPRAPRVRLQQRRLPVLLPQLHAIRLQQLRLPSVRAMRPQRRSARCSPPHWHSPLQTRRSMLPDRPLLLWRSLLPARQWGMWARRSMMRARQSMLGPSRSVM